MLLWFVGGSIVTIWFVFADANFDYRLLPVGSLLPAVLELPFGARVMHSLIFSAVLLAVVVVATKRHSPRRRLLMGIPLGTLLYLVLTGAWVENTVFWWPFFGFKFNDAQHPALVRCWWNLGLELLGAAMCWWVWHRAELSRAERRREFINSGRLHLPTR